MNSLRNVSIAGWFALLCVGACGSPLVGLECRDGYDRCGGGCYDLSDDSQHCGGCDIVCGGGMQCVAAQCVAAPGDGGADGGDADVDIDASRDGGLDGSPDDGALGDGAPDDGATDGAADGAQADGSMSEGGAGDGGDGGQTDGAVQPPVLCTGTGSPADCTCGIGQTKCDATLSCVDTSTDHENCGTCGNACAMDEVCTLGVCDLICAPPVVLCAGLCIDFQSNDAHCGGCNQPCSAAAACIDGMCVGAAVGHVVVIGHDMSVIRPQIRQLVGNAVFLAPRAPVRVLVYDAETSVASRVGVSSAIAQSAALVGRAYVSTTAAPETVTQQLANADVFVIEPQQGATDSELSALGSAWSSALDDFLFRGGVVLLFDGGPDTGDMNQGTYQVLSSATIGSPAVPLFDASQTTWLSQRILSLVRPGDAIGNGVSTQYQSQGETVGFTLNSTPATPHNIVIADTLGTMPTNLPVVVHVVFSP